MKYLVGGAKSAATRSMRRHESTHNKISGHPINREWEPKYQGRNIKGGREDLRALAVNTVSKCDIRLSVMQVHRCKSDIDYAEYAVANSVR